MRPGRSLSPALKQILEELIPRVIKQLGLLQVLVFQSNFNKQLNTLMVLMLLESSRWFW